MISINPLDADAMERLGFAMNGVSLVRSHKAHPCFAAAHAQTMLAVYTHLTDLAEHTVFAGEDYAHLPGGNESDTQSKNDKVLANVAALVSVNLPKPKPVIPVKQSDPAEPDDTEKARLAAIEDEVKSGQGDGT